MNNNSIAEPAEKSLEKKLSELKKDQKVINDLSDNSNKVRRNLIFFSTITIFLKLSDAYVGGNINISGLIISNLDECKILIGLYLIILYHLCHFFCVAYEKITDIRSDKKRLRAYEGFHNLSIPQIESDQMKPLQKRMSLLEKRIVEEAPYSKLEPNLRKKISKEDYEEIVNNTFRRQSIIFLKQVNNIFKDMAISEALYMESQGFQVVRWYLLEIGFPIILGAIAIICLLFDYSL